MMLPRSIADGTPGSSGAVRWPETPGAEVGGGADARVVRGIVTMEVSMLPVTRGTIVSGKASAGWRPLVVVSRARWDGPGTGASLSGGGTPVT